MWKDSDGNDAPASAQYRAPNGTLYPSDFPKAEVPGLVWAEPEPHPEPEPEPPPEQDSPPSPDPGVAP